MVDYDTIGTTLQLIGAQFFNFLLRRLSRDFKLHRISILHEFQGPYFAIA